MTDTSAAQVEESNLDVGLDQPEIETNTETPDAESAPAPVVEDAQKDDAVQQRINKEVSRRHIEKRRADEAERQLEEYKANAPVVKGVAPELKDFDYDQDKFTEASISYQVEQALSTRATNQTKVNVDAQAKEAVETYDKLVSGLGKDDFFEVVANIPLLDQGLAAELMSTEEGVEMLYHLGNHLDVADRIANMSPLQAMGELGRISANMSAQPTIKPSAAPDPIEPLNSGGSISKERGPSGATFS